MTGKLTLVAPILVVLAATSCSDDDSDADSGNTGGSQNTGGDDNAGGSDNTGGSSAGGTNGGTGGSPATGGQAAGGEDGGGTTLCAKYGGASVVETVMKDNVLGAIAADCRINPFFTSLSSEKLTHVGDCLAIMGQELFGCPGVVYEGSMSSVGGPCRSMEDAHLGLNISQGDFDALIEDVVAGLTEAGVEEDDIMAAAPALLGMQDAIVEETETEPSKPECAPDAGADGG